MKPRRALQNRLFGIQEGILGALAVMVLIPTVQSGARAQQAQVAPLKSMEDADHFPNTAPLDEAAQRWVKEQVKRQAPEVARPATEQVEELSPLYPVTPFKPEVKPEEVQAVLVSETDLPPPGLVLESGPYTATCLIMDDMPSLLCFAKDAIAWEPTRTTALAAVPSAIPLPKRKPAGVPSFIPLPKKKPTPVVRTIWRAEDKRASWQSTVKECLPWQPNCESPLK